MNVISIANSNLRSTYLSEFITDNLVCLYMYQLNYNYNETNNKVLMNPWTQ